MRKTVLITGAAGGLGRELAQVYGQAGWQLALADNDAPLLEQTAQTLAAAGFNVLTHACDVRNDHDVQAFIDNSIRHYGDIHCLINNAGVAVAGSIDGVTLTDWQWVMDINLLGVVRGCHYAVARMKTQGFGQLINIASLAGLLTLPEMSAYNASKAAVVSLSETLHAELAPYGIRVHVVCPGFFKTGLGRSLRSPNPATAAHLEKLMLNSSLSAREIARTIYQRAALNDLYILPHRSGNTWWHLKRYSPLLYFRLMQRTASRLYRYHQR